MGYVVPYLVGKVRDEILVPVIVNRNEEKVTSFVLAETIKQPLCLGFYLLCFCATGFMHLSEALKFESIVLRSIL